MTARAINAGGDTNSCMWCQALGYVILTPSFMILKYSRNAATVAMMIALACLPLWMANGSCGDVVTVSRALSGTDVTTAIQKVLDSGARQVVLDRAGSPYVTCPLFVRSNTEIIFEEGVELLAKEGEFHNLHDALVTLPGSTNVVLRGLGKGATLRMRIKDYQSDAYSHGEWRHAINLLSAADVTIENLTLADSGGDGIYVGAMPSTVPCRNIVIRNCICDNNNRQGISVISADGLLIERTVMKNTRGTAPRSGIDFEPNTSRQVLKKIVMRNCLTENNAGAGYELYAGSHGRSSEPIDIMLENCRSVGDRTTAFKVAFASRNSDGLPRGGTIRAKNCTFSGCKSSSVMVRNKPNGVVDVLLENCTIERNQGLPTDVPDVKLVTDDRNALPTDEIELRNVTICRPDAMAKWFDVTKMPWSPVGMDNVKGAVRLVADGKAENVALDDAWCTSMFPRSVERYVLDSVEFDAAKVRRVIDDNPGERAALSPVTLRFALNALVCAAKPGPVAFAVRMVRVGSSKIKDVPFTVKDMSGRTVAILPAATEKMEDRMFAAPSAGFYSLTCDMSPHGLSFASCDAPIGFMPVPKYGLDIYRSQGDVFLVHGAEVDETFFCGGTGEAATVSLFDPAGEECAVWRNQTDWGFRRIGTKDGEGLWRVGLVRADDGYVWEDVCLDRAGTSPVFFLAKEKYWISGK